MRVTFSNVLGLLAATLTLAFASACGGGGGGGTTTPVQPLPVTQPLEIVTNDLPGALQNHAYSTTLVAQGGQAPFHWSIAPSSAPSQFVNGLQIDANSGVLSGTVSFTGTAGFVATVTDAASHSATHPFTISAFGQLTASPSKTFTVDEFTQLFGGVPLDFSGGVPPLQFRVVGGSLPPGMRLNQSGIVANSAIGTGTFVANVEIRDSFSPAEVANQQLTITVAPPPFGVANSLPSRLILNAPFAGKVIANGGTPPYTFSVLIGTVPTGLSSIDPATGQISGTPTTAGQYSFFVRATDSGTPQRFADTQFTITVGSALGRNDSVATATPLPGNGFFQGSISPYIDPPNAAPTPGDSDYYKLVSIAGATVTITASPLFNSPIDPVLEIVDVNGHQFNTCNQGNPAGTFTSLCVNDDINPGLNVSSLLNFQVPGAAGSQVTFYVHVLDFRGDARPDMNYQLAINGLAVPLGIAPNPLPVATVGKPYFGQITPTGGSFPYTWSVASGSTMPPGLTVSSSGAVGAITGTPTTAGIFPVVVQVTDSGVPQQTATGQVTIEIVDALKITSPTAFPDACVNQPYSFQVTTQGGKPPLSFFFQPSPTWPLALDAKTGVFSGTPSAVGTSNAVVGVQDAAFNAALLGVTLTVKTCP